MKTTTEMIEKRDALKAVLFNDYNGFCRPILNEIDKLERDFIVETGETMESYTALYLS